MEAVKLQMVSEGGQYPELAKARNQETQALFDAGITHSMTVGEFIEKGSDRDMFLYAHGRLTRLAYIRWPDTNPWAVCPDDNGGYGASYCVHYGTPIYLK